MNIAPEDLDVVVHLPNDRRKTLRYLTSKDCLEIALSRTDPAERDHYRTVARRLRGYENLEAAIKASR